MASNNIIAENKIFNIRALSTALAFLTSIRLKFITTRGNVYLHIYNVKGECRIQITRAGKSQSCMRKEGYATSKMLIPVHCMLLKYSQVSSILLTDSALLFLSTFS